MEDKKVSENSTFSFPITTLPQLTFVPTKLTTKEFKRVEYLVNGSNSSIFTAYHGNEKVAVKMLKERWADRSQTLIPEMAAQPLSRSN